MTLCNRKYGAHYSLKAAPWKSGGGANVPRYPSTMKHGFKKTLWIAIFFYYRGCHLIVSCVCVWEWVSRLFWKYGKKRVTSSIPLGVVSRYLSCLYVYARRLHHFPLDRCEQEKPLCPAICLRLLQKVCWKFLVKAVGVHLHSRQ